MLRQKEEEPGGRGGQMHSPEALTVQHVVLFCHRLAAPVGGAAEKQELACGILLRSSAQLLRAQCFRWFSQLGELALSLFYVCGPLTHRAVLMAGPPMALSVASHVTLVTSSATRAVSSAAWWSSISAQRVPSLPESVCHIFLSQHQLLFPYPV